MNELFAEDEPKKEGDYWYLNRHQLECGQVFRTEQGAIVQLDRSVPGDGTKWYVADWYRGWTYQDSTIEPGELCGDPIEDVKTEIAKGAVFSKYEDKTRPLADTSIDDIPAAEQKKFWDMLDESGPLTDADADFLYKTWYAAQEALALSAKIAPKIK